MTPHFLPNLVNRSFGDPGVYLDFLFERRAILFDLGDLAPLAPRKLLRISDVLISHTHIDHFIGFDTLLRILLGREKSLRLFGPPGFLRQLESRLASYSWNLVGSYPCEFRVVGHELHPDGRVLAAGFSSRRAFAREDDSEGAFEDGLILNEADFQLRVAFLEHSLPCLAFAFQEKRHVNFMKNRLEELGAPVGPWLSEVKGAVLRDAPDHTLIRVAPGGKGLPEEMVFTLGELKERVLELVPGEKVAYVTDTAYTPENCRRIVELAQGADYFFIEATFLDADRERAADRAHLTARQAGELARAAGAARVIPFHFSPRYLGREHELRREVQEAFQGDPAER
ncbi:ribonuclease Z [Geomonas silvestris]|uniref:Ribonuclease Z n=1 Tax=Geomonas silvestris TaxID=2740184 RepID=A0A6V8MEY3_9BACT|nr:MBL fold metallo-hydrolase [Geomonas silvestris]GFO58492.1 ribonuclease Z [Geomonas silvestris]